MKYVLAVSLVLILSAKLLSSGEPMSAIDWISKSSRPDVIQSIEPDIINETTASDNSVVLKSYLGTVSLNSIGIIPAESLELPRNIWSDSNEMELVRLLENLPTLKFHAGNIFLRKLLIAETSSPFRNNDDGSFLVQRLESLTNLGALEEVETILNLANPESGELLRIWGDNGFLTGRIGRFCNKVISLSNIEIEKEIRILCLANRNQWQNAALVLSSAIALDKIELAEKELLLLYLEPEYTSSLDFQKIDNLTPFTFYLRDIVGIPTNTSELQKKYDFKELANEYDFKKRVAAKFKFVKSGILSFDHILDELPPSYFVPVSVGKLGLINYNQPINFNSTYEAKVFQKFILRLSHEFEDVDLLIPLLKLFANDIVNAYQKNPVYEMNELFIISYLLGTNWVPIENMNINKHSDLLIAKIIKSKALTKEVINNEDICDNFCKSVSQSLLLKDTDKYRYRNPPQTKKAGEKILQSLSLISEAENAEVNNISKGFNLLMEAGQTTIAEKFAVEFLVRRHLEKKSDERLKLKKMIESYRKGISTSTFEVNVTEHNKIEEAVQGFAKLLDGKYNRIQFGGKDFVIKGRLKPNKFSLELKHDF